MKLRVFIALSLIFFVAHANAYVGPGLGAGTIAAIAGVFMSIFMAIVGIFWYPLKRLFKKSKPEESLAETEEDDAQQVEKSTTEQN